MADVILQALIGLPDGPTVSYLRLHYFCSEGTRAFIDAINMSEFWGVDGYIIDLRNNPGGCSRLEGPLRSCAMVCYCV